MIRRHYDATATHVLFIGSTGSIGRLAVDEAVRAGYATRTLVRDATRVRFDPRVDVFQGDLTDIDSLRATLDGVVFTMDAHDGPCMVEKVDYGAVRNTLLALDGRKVRIALMTAIGVTYMDTDYNRVSQAHDWKRRSERLVRASGNEYTIVRPGWFDYNDPDQQRLVFLQGDTHRHASPEDGVVSRKQIAQVLVGALGCETPTIRRWSSWPNAAPRRNNSTRFSPHWNRTIRIASTACTTRRTSPTAASPNAYAKTWPASPALRTRPSEPHVPHTTPARTTARL